MRRGAASVQEGAAAPGAARFRERLCCELCGASPAATLAEMPFESGPVADFLAHYYGGRLDPACLAGGRYAIRHCTACGFLWQGAVLEETGTDDAEQIGLQTLYERWIDPEESQAKARRLGPRARLRLIAQIATGAALAGRPQGTLRALDFGMGWGVWCESARGLGIEAVGAELSTRRVAHARARGIEVLALPQVGRRFDLINTEQVFEHLCAPVPMLEILADHLAPGGVLRISVPDARRTRRAIARGRWQPGKDALHPLEHVNGFEHATLRRLGASAGLVPVGPGRLGAALVRAAWRTAAIVPVALAEILYGHLHGTAIWFARPDDHGRSQER